MIWACANSDLALQYLSKQAMISMGISIWIRCSSNCMQTYARRQGVQEKLISSLERRKWTFASEVIFSLASLGFACLLFASVEIPPVSDHLAILMFYIAWMWQVYAGFAQALTTVFSLPRTHIHLSVLMKYFNGPWCFLFMRRSFLISFPNDRKENLSKMEIGKGWERKYYRWLEWEKSKQI